MDARSEPLGQDPHVRLNEHGTRIDGKFNDLQAAGREVRPAHLRVVVEAVVATRLDQGHPAGVRARFILKARTIINVLQEPLSEFLAVVLMHDSGYVRERSPHPSGALLRRGPELLSKIREAISSVELCDVQPVENR